jgi:DNA-directed RNA polymerase specialized sigma subunit
MDEKFGRAATQIELADKLGWSPREIGVLQKEIRKARPTGQFESDPSAYTPSRQKEILRLLPYELNTDERQVFEYLYGVGGKTRMSPGQIAKKLNMSAPKVSRLKRAIANKYAKHSE